MLYVIVMIVVIGIVIFFSSKIFYEFENELSETLEQTPRIDQYNETQNSLRDIINTERVIWDYAFLAIMIGYIIAIGIFSYQTPINPVFFWISMLLALFWLFIGTVMSNLWMGMAEQPELADTVARFPIMNTILGSYYPTVITFVILIGMILLFSKPFGGEAR